ncbi:hypothetical protein NDU88_002275 [Pleurodeles waltl]|uniref:Uncharacterized protein n=1 Tax=Pleurodeles waltl TaxID=8319 RepID=A0AAV7MR62_PLEWA|nr:hypothetical protein NDU88_002275 [Pleurodeles waltl]
MSKCAECRFLTLATYRGSEEAVGLRFRLSNGFLFPLKVAGAQSSYIQKRAVPLLTAASEVFRGREAVARIPFQGRCGRVSTSWIYKGTGKDLEEGEKAFFTVGAARSKQERRRSQVDKAEGVARSRARREEGKIGVRGGRGGAAYSLQSAKVTIKRIEVESGENFQKQTAGGSKEEQINSLADSTTLPEQRPDEAEEVCPTVGATNPKIGAVFGGCISSSCNGAKFKLRPTIA